MNEPFQPKSNASAHYEGSTQKRWRFPYIWSERVQACVNQPELKALYFASPNKRRRLYLELTQDLSRQAVFNWLETQGFDWVLLPKPDHASLTSEAPAFGYLVSGTTAAIVRFIHEHADHIELAKVDLPEYSWLNPSTAVAATK